MLRRVAIACSTAISLSIPLTVSADCINPTTPYDQTYCTAKLFIESDAELNSVYDQLKKLVNKNTKSDLKNIQRAWIAYRDQECSVGGTIQVQCNFEANKARTEYLRDRLRECKTGQCNDAMIGAKSWQ